MDGETLARVAEDVTIFSRMNPVQKNRVLNSLKRNGHVVGFMGDGINDAPSNTGKPMSAFRLKMLWTSPANLPISFS